MESTSKDGAVVNVDSEFVDYSRPLSAVLAEELSASANRSSNEVVRAIEEVLPEFEALKDCILKLLKVTRHSLFENIGKNTNEICNISRKMKKSKSFMMRTRTSAQKNSL